MNTDRHTISILGDGYFYSIAILIQKLIEEQNKSSDSVYVSGLSSSICLLSVATLESYMRRVQFLKYEKKDTPYTLLDKIFSSYLSSKTSELEELDEEEMKELKTKMKEVFILRDLVFHNHVWEELYDSSTGDKINEKAFGGDHKYRENIDISIRKTKKLALNIIPTDVTYKDAKIVLETILEILNFIENIDNSLVSISNSYAYYEGEQILFSDIVKKMNNSLSK